jgi:hypothetical protein
MPDAVKVDIRYHTCGLAVRRQRRADLAARILPGHSKIDISPLMRVGIAPQCHIFPRDVP